MKKTELIIGAIALIALVLNLLMVPFSGLLTVLSLSLLSMIYMYFSFALFNGIRLRTIFKKSARQGVSNTRIFGSVLTGFALAMTTVGILFKIQDWPFGFLNLLIGLAGLAIALIVGAIGYSRTKSPYFTKIFKRIAVWGGLAVILLLIPKETFLELRYRSHPEYIEAVKQSMADPGNEALQDKVNEEHLKMNQGH